MELSTITLLSTTIPTEVVEWVRQHGNSHVRLLNEWKRDPTSPFYKDFDMVRLCLACSLQRHNRKKEVCYRLLGRARQIRMEMERLEYEVVLTTEDCLL